MNHIHSAPDIVASEGESLGFSIQPAIGPVESIVTFLRFAVPLDGAGTDEHIGRFITAIVETEVMKSSLELKFRNGLMAAALRSLLDDQGLNLSRDQRNRAEAALQARLFDYEF